MSLWLQKAEGLADFREISIIMVNFKSQHVDYETCCFQAICV